MDSLVSTHWLAERLGAPDLRILDASWHMPASARDARAEFEAGHIHGARFLDIDALSNTSSAVPHMLPAPSDFATAMERLAVGNGHRIVVYDNSPLRTAARGWFMLRHFGARRVAILDGGLQKWLAEGRAVERGVDAVASVSFTTAPRDDVVAKQQIAQGLAVPLLDARGRPRFEGIEPDPRPGVAPGHIPGARNLPFPSLYNHDGTFKPLADLRKLFAQAGIDPVAPFIATCGSGVTANSLIFAAHLLGNDSARLYDGSWSEWGADPATPKAVGPA